MARTERTERIPSAAGDVETVTDEARAKQVDVHCVNHPQRKAVFTTPEDAGFAQVSFCASCVATLHPQYRQMFAEQQAE